METSPRGWRLHWRSWLLFTAAYVTFGQMLHNTEAAPLIWGMSIGLMIAKASLLTFFWHPARKFMLLGFQSDAGYSIMVLALASLAVLFVVQFRAFAYVIVLVATALLVRVDCLVDGFSDRQSFQVLLALPLLGLGMTWLPKALYLGVNNIG
ncbi:MAG: hypothetical protein ACFB0C_09590 [Leptolyngbyaceae cyanobacterium]